MQEDYSQFMDKLKVYINKQINANTIQNLDIEAVNKSIINGWRSLGTEQSIGYGGQRDRDQYTVGNNNSSAPIASA